MQILKALLAPFSILFGLVIGIRNILFDVGIFKQYLPSLPTICIGNLTTGGEGKSPHTEYLVKLLKDDYKLATLSRGYGRKTKGFLLGNETTGYKNIGDEPAQYQLKFKTIQVAVCENRANGIEVLRKQPIPPEVIILDDAFQHRWVKPGLSLLITAYQKLFIDDHLLPWGNLRENKNGFKRANIIVVSKCPKTISIGLIDKIKQRLCLQAHQQLFFSCISYSPLISINPQFPFVDIKDLSTQTILLVTGIAQPQSLLDHLNSLNINTVHLKFRDHHDFKPEDATKIITTYNKLNKTGKEIIITTEKDAVKLRHQTALNAWPMYYLPIEIEILNNQGSEFNKSIKNFVTNFKY